MTQSHLSLLENDTEVIVTGNNVTVKSLSQILCIPNCWKILQIKSIMEVMKCDINGVVNSLV